MRRENTWVKLPNDQRITSGPAARRPHSKAEYMTAPERFADSGNFLLHRGRRPYMTHLCHLMINFALIHSSALMQRCGTVRPLV